MYMYMSCVCTCLCMHTNVCVCVSVKVGVVVSRVKTPAAPTPCWLMFNVNRDDTGEKAANGHLTESNRLKTRPPRKRLQRWPHVPCFPLKKFTWPISLRGLACESTELIGCKGNSQEANGYFGFG